MRLIKIPNRIYPPGIDFSVQSQILYEVKNSVSTMVFDELLGAVFNDLYDSVSMRGVKAKLMAYEGMLDNVAVGAEHEVDFHVEKIVRIVIGDWIAGHVSEDLESIVTP
jgi:hypothetical protein